MRILYHETSAYAPVSPLFIEALQALANLSLFVDEARFIANGTAIARRIVNRMLPHPLGYRALNREMVTQARRFRPDLVLVAKGACVAAGTLAAIKHDTGALLVNYATDDPFNRRNGANTAEMIQAIPLYDLYATTRIAAIEDLKRSGAGNVAYIRFGYKPSVHFPEHRSGAEPQSDLVFVGACDQDRAPVFEDLVKSVSGLRLGLYGGYWNRYPSLRGYWRGFAYGADFRRALAASKIAINLVRRANRDDHVMRTFEIPACGAFMMAERTETHLELFEEGREAVYFSSAEELKDKVRYYLGHDSERDRIAAAGYRRVISGNHTYGDRLAQILEAARELR